MGRGAVREYPLLCPAFFFVAPGAAKGHVKFPLVQRLAQPFRLHDLGMNRRARGDRGNAAPQSLFVDMHEKIHAEPRRGLVAKRDHLAKFPSRIDVQ